MVLLAPRFVVPQFGRHPRLAGTRSPNPEWKKGFYYIAQKAEIPILLYGVDYEKRLINCTKTIIPNGDIDAQMKEIKTYFKDFKGKKPENFTTGDI